MSFIDDIKNMLRPSKEDQALDRALKQKADRRRKTEMRLMDRPHATDSGLGGKVGVENVMTPRPIPKAVLPSPLPRTPIQAIRRPTWDFAPKPLTPRNTPSFPLTPTSRRPAVMRRNSSEQRELEIKLNKPRFT
jgi:hypothetical protein